MSMQTLTIQMAARKSLRNIILNKHVIWIIHSVCSEKCSIDKGLFALSSLVEGGKW